MAAMQRRSGAYSLGMAAGIAIAILAPLWLFGVSSMPSGFHPVAGCALFAVIGAQATVSGFILFAIGLVMTGVTRGASGWGSALVVAGLVLSVAPELMADTRATACGSAPTAVSAPPGIQGPVKGPAPRTTLPPL